MEISKVSGQFLQNSENICLVSVKDSNKPGFRN